MQWFVVGTRIRTTALKIDALVRDRRFAAALTHFSDSGDRD
jgi:hypothetical protein